MLATRADRTHGEVGQSVGIPGAPMTALLESLGIPGIHRASTFPFFGIPTVGSPRDRYHSLFWNTFRSLH